MSTPRRLFVSTLLTVLLTLTATAGDMDTPKAPNPSPTIRRERPVSRPATRLIPAGVDFFEVSFVVVRNVLSIF